MVGRGANREAAASACAYDRGLSVEATCTQGMGGAFAPMRRPNHDGLPPPFPRLRSPRPCLTPVRHADDDGLHAQIRRPIDQDLHAGDQRLAALQPKALGRAVLVGEEGLKHLTPGHTVQDLQLLLLAELGLHTEGEEIRSGVECVQPYQEHGPT